LVVVLTIEIVASLQVSLAVGASKLHATPHSTILPGTHVIVGGVLSCTLMIWVQLWASPQRGVTVQVRAMV
jgi:hypothetical protein